MNQQPPLFRQKNTWTHYIGGYYRTTDDFIREARAQGVTRRIPAQVARGMQYGDRVVLLRWGGKGRVWAFAEMLINGVVLGGKEHREGELARKVGERLQAEGRAHYTEGGGAVERECGCYLVCGTWTVDAELSEIMDIAIQTAEQEGTKCFAMIGGALSKVYAEPVLLSPAPKFTRGFTRADDQATGDTEHRFEFHGQQAEPVGGKMVSIKDYHHRERDRRRHLPLIAA